MRNVRNVLFLKDFGFGSHKQGKTRRPAPGELRAIEHWELPPTVTAMRAFLGFVS